MPSRNPAGLPGSPGRRVRSFLGGSATVTPPGDAGASNVSERANTNVRPPDAATGAERGSVAVVGPEEPAASLLDGVAPALTFAACRVIFVTFGLE